MDRFGEQMKGFSVCLSFIGVTFMACAYFLFMPVPPDYTVFDFAVTMGILLMLMGLTGWVATKARKQAVESDMKEASEDFVKDTLTKAARQGSKEWQSWDKE